MEVLLPRIAGVIAVIAGGGGRPTQRGQVDSMGCCLDVHVIFGFGPGIDIDLIVDEQE